MSALPPPGAPVPPLEVRQPSRQTLPLVLSSPHSGESYPADFIAASRLDRLALRRSEDSFVDELFAAAPALGAPLIRALFPRAYVDPNREPWELDPAMFEDALPSYVNVNSPRVAAGLGTIARVGANGEEIYGGKLRFSDAKARHAGGYVPQHYGRPSAGVHALQIEINRALYMDEALLSRGPGFARMAETMTGLIREVGRMFPVVLAE